MRHRLRALLFAACCVGPPAAAHELQSVALWLHEEAPGRIAVTLKTPLARDGGAVAVVPRFPAGCRNDDEPRVDREAGTVVRQWRETCRDGLAGMRLRIEGLDPRAPEAMVVARFADGRSLTLAVDRHDPEAVLAPPAQAAGLRLSAYLELGVEHILLGTDHLLFVLGLILVVGAAGRGRAMLVAALTAFTLAHSFTLACAVLGLWGLPPRPVELSIALSIVLLALELAEHPRRAAAGLAPSLTLRKPWLVAFGFGLLHGFGFAGALAAIGLPEPARAWALLLFNAGVEIGQLLFVAAVLLVLAALRRLHAAQPRAAGAAATVLGGVAMYWTLERAVLWTEALWPGV
ncbi:MAG: HupE/UreJ family protein [Gammaproteobacteria bacterium]|nr:HupE/UreJ family protein [Gammaproteobacteria bacterium]